MTQATPAKIAAGCCALGAFSVAIIAGLAADNPADVILTRAIISMFVCYLIGVGIGHAGSLAIDEGVRAHRAANPTPGDEPESGDSGSTEPEIVV